MTATSLPDFLGPFRLARFIRSGSTCQIWEAIKDDGSGRYVLKVLRREHWGNRAESSYLKHEYEVAHRLDHPNVIRVFDFSIEGKIAYLVLELYAVVNLKQLLRDNPQLLLYHFTKIVQQCALGLQHMHEKKWVHCDIKPDNFLFSDDAEVKLIDFTISRKAVGRLGKWFTRKGTIRGTRSYMSPEQIRGKGLDARSDIYSLGCVMYELLTSKLPYTGSSPDDLLNKHLKAPIPSVVVQNHQVTNQLADLIRRMMAKDLDERPASMSEVIKELHSIRSFKSAPKLPDAQSTGEGESTA